MIDAISRHRPLMLLASVVAAQVLLLAYQVKRDHDVRLIRYWSAEASMPAARSGSWFFSHLGGLWTGYVDLHNARKENADLRAQVGQLELRNSQLATQAAEAQHLQILLNFHNAHPEAQMLAAQVIGASADTASETIYINRGEDDKVKRNMGVITPDGVVGKIVEVLPNTAEVMLMTDKDMGVGAMFSDSRTHGVVKGTGDPVPMMDYIVNDEKIQPGETIITSGEDRIFPKGLLVGAVGTAKEGNPFQKIQVQPAARLDRLEDVIVLVTQQELAPGKQGDGFRVSPAPPPPTPAPAATDAANSGSTPAANSSNAKPATQGAPVK
jgi:rod shape-determining protein MreC